MSGVSKFKTVRATEINTVNIYQEIAIARKTKVTAPSLGQAFMDRFRRLYAVGKFEKLR